jgi:hypothetical protein
MRARKRWQFGLRTLFLLITLAALLAAIPWSRVGFLAIPLLFYVIVLGVTLLIRRAIERG